MSRLLSGIFLSRPCYSSSHSELLSTRFDPGDDNVFVSNIDGTDKRRIETGNPFDFAPQWSPDGQWLMFASGEQYDCHPHVVKNGVKNWTGKNKTSG